jgi:diacylglycerol O-acyltransferase / wax synthase
MLGIAGDARGAGGAMAYSHYDRLSALDATFLAIEDANVHMHVGAVAVFDGRPLLAPHGGLDFERIRALAGPALARSRRFRQRLAHVPVLGHPVWVDDDRFQVDYHLRHTALPAPGDERQLKRLAGRILSQKLDLHKPLWELWFVENLEGDRFALISKVHHCMIDGVSGVDLLGMLMQAQASGAEQAAEEAPRWLPRPAPGPARLVAGELARRAALPLEVLRAGGRALGGPRRSLAAARDAVLAVSEILSPGLRGATVTPINGPIGPHRRFDWTELDLGLVKEIRERLGGTVNDVVLAIVAGAMRTFLAQRGVAVDDLEFRAQVPVNIRAAREHGKLGNRIATLVAPLPVAEPDARRRHARVLETTRALKGSKQVRGAELLEALGDWTAKEILAGIVRMTSQGLAFNMTVTNVPGPSFEAYLLDAPMRAVYPVVPLFSHQGVGIALFSYHGRLFWGFNACWDAVPDLHDLVLAVQLEFETLRKL